MPGKPQIGGKIYQLHYNSFDSTLDLEDINVVNQIAQTHGEDMTALYVGAGSAHLEFSFHCRIEESMNNPDVGNAPNADEYLEKWLQRAYGWPVEIVTLGRMQQLVQPWFPSEVNNLTPFFREDYEICDSCGAEFVNGTDGQICPRCLGDNANPPYDGQSTGGVPPTPGNKWEQSTPMPGPLGPKKR